MPLDSNNQYIASLAHSHPRNSFVLTGPRGSTNTFRSTSTSFSRTRTNSSSVPGLNNGDLRSSDRRPHYLGQISMAEGYCRLGKYPSSLKNPKQPHQSTSYHAAAVPSFLPYDCGETASLCQRFIKALFSCTSHPPYPTESPSTTTPSLAEFVAHTLHSTRLHPSVTFTALFLLSRLKSLSPAGRGSSGHRLFISAFMIASKVMCDDTYSNKSWTAVCRGMFSLREINQMEREMCGYLEWRLTVDSKELEEFEAKLRKDYASGPCPAFVHPSLPAFSASSASSTAPPTTQTNVVIPTSMDVQPASLQLGSHKSDSASSTMGRTLQSDDDKADKATSVLTYMHNGMTAETSGPTRTNSAPLMSSAWPPPKSTMGRYPSYARPQRTIR